MKLTSQEEYGLRCLLQIARGGEGSSLTIPVLSELEGLSPAYGAKLMRILRQGGFVKSARGQAGGYTLARSPDQIVVGEVLAVLGGRLFESSFCDHHAGIDLMCVNSVDCSIRSLWRSVQLAIDRVISKTTLKDLLHNEQAMTSWVNNLVQVSGDPMKSLEIPPGTSR